MKPIIKWAGGKGRLLTQLKLLLPADIESRRYVEPFFGGGAMYFDLQPQNACIADINVDLINMYIQVATNVDLVISNLRWYAEFHDEEFYYKIRTRYNSNPELVRATRAAMFLYLNKTCFNGLYRVNKKGEFNVPIGSYKNPNIVNEEVLREASTQLSDISMLCTGFESVPTFAHAGDFVYFDPPYEPVSKTANFTAYTPGGFTQQDQTDLRDVFVELDRKGCKVMLSNSDVPFIRDIYQDFNITEILAARSINSKGVGRGVVSEVVIRNYHE